MRILLIGARLRRNLGGPSLLISTKMVLDEVLQAPEYIYVSPESEDAQLGTAYGMPVLLGVSFKTLVACALTKRYLGVSVGPPAARALVKAYSDSDAVIDMWGIEFSDSVGRSGFRARAIQGCHLLLGRIFGRIVVKYTADLGPFETRWNRFFSKLYLGHCVDLILARDQATKDRVMRLGVATSVRVHPDTAFLLNPEPSALARDLGSLKASGAVVGLSVSHMAARQSDDPAAYARVMAELADFIVEEIGACVVLIPNELSSCPKDSDSHVATSIHGLMKHKTFGLILPTSDYSAGEVKGIIGQCDVVVASRYHSIVAALSQGIPVLAVGWHVKYAGVLELFAMEQFSVSVKSISIHELKVRFRELWEQRARLRQQIEARLPDVRKAVLRGGEEVSQLIRDRSSHLR